MSNARIELCNVRGRASLLLDGRVVDVERRSAGSFSADPMAALARWPEFRAFAQVQRAEPGDPALDATQLGPCVPRPGQIFGIGLNYRDHAKESGMQEPAQPVVFTKFPSCVGGARAQVALTSNTVDWEVELVVVIGTPARNVDASHALAHVAGYCVGQDLSDRRLQFASVPPQFSLAKSAPNFGPVGPCLVADDSLDPQQLTLLCDVNGKRMQHGSTADMIFPVAALIAYLSRHCHLLPGDLIFTGTPSGVGSGHKPPLYLQPGDAIRSEIPGLGVLENHCLAAG